ncbi:auxin efflux carrier [Cokeromyces recurvatus]|uniref:auxin efflux carrier n=1 Tax=Cokeromyces recurvatus TaxID=90255 RepID=UPI00221F41E5|nr:auxin efflux carrier [Cokeromyces recurvatus]KAI7905924.1 auxin efflux carrier [Cokeromyces recurvatus]
MLELAISAIQAILQVIIIVFTGAFLSNKGYIDNDKQKWLSKLNLVFFTPCLLFSSIASVMSFNKLLDFWPIPVFYIMFTSISWILCRAASPIFGIDNYHKPFVIACSIFNNANSLPVAIISSLAVSEAGKTLFWGSNDSQKMASARGISYTLFFGLFSNLLRWSYGYNLLKKSEGDDKTEEDDKSNINSNYGSTTYSSENNNRQASSSSSSSESSSTLSYNSNKYQDLENNTNDRNRPKKDRKSYPNNNKNDEDNRLLGKCTDDGQQKGTKNLSIIYWIKSMAQKYMSPPLYAALLALFVGLCPPIKNLLYSEDQFLYASLTKGIESCGKASVPLVLICLGAQLKTIRETQPKSRPQHRRPVALSIFIRMLLAPICVLSIIFVFAKWGSRWSKLAEDPMFIVCMIIVGCTPTAINLAQITQVNNVYEEEMLNVLFWSYAVICVPVCTFIVFLALYMVKQMK